jgi:multisubunit Na+/H+ antiporter MnhG subunit
MRQQLRTLGRAFTGILNVLLFLGTFFVFLAIIGLQLFSDDIYNACRLTKEPVEIGGKRVW